MPHSQIPNYIRAGPWDCIEKKVSRRLTIIDVYRQFFQEQVPENKQYWSMCGAHFDKDGRPILGELGYLLENGLIQKHQYFGVDQELSIIENNRKLFPDINWVHGDFKDVMEQFYLNGKFNPAIINYDGVMQPRFGVHYLKKILKFLDYNFRDELLLVSNFVLVNPYSKSDKLKFTIQYTLDELFSIYWIPDHWKILPKAYLYSGVSQVDESQMGVIMLVKGKHDIRHITFSKNRKIDRMLEDNV